MLMRRNKITHVPTSFEPTESDGGDKIITEAYQFELITPMFGGDSQSWKLDTKNPVRSASVKGQLRFWWRTMQNETDVKVLLFKENQRWGGNISEDVSDVIKSPVMITIIKQAEIKTDTVIANPKGNALGVNVIPNYVLFPVTENVTKKKEKITIVTELKFTLLITYPEKYQQELLDTLTLWSLFGGVGARTRRGTGSLYCAQLMKDFNSKKDIKNWLTNIGSHQIQAQKYPRITGANFFIDDSNDGGSSQSIWKSLLSNYGSYRQERREGRPSPGRSYWPEPDAIRTITGQSATTHETPVNYENWFPRAAFGLPILTKFSTIGDPGSNPGSNQTIHLEPDEADLEHSERYPSPMFLKVIKLNGGEVLSCCLVLNQLFPEQLKLVSNRTYRINQQQLPSAISSREMKTNDPLLANESVYHHLARSLELEEVK